jgi:hypothetical protein
VEQCGTTGTELEQAKLLTSVNKFAHDHHHHQYNYHEMMGKEKAPEGA